MTSMESLARKITWESLGCRSESPHKVFCFPFSGGSPLYFREWGKLLPDNIEMIILSCPGKGARIGEEPIDIMDNIVDEILACKDVFMEEEYTFFGHSLGAWVATAVCARLYSMGVPLPRHFIISGSIPLCFRRFPPFVHQMTDEDLIRELKVLGGTPEIMLNDLEFMKSFFPGIRADFKLFEQYHYTEKKPLPIDISIWSGIDDPRVPAGVGHYWKLFFRGNYTERFFEGGHMFIGADSSRSECIEELIGVVSKDVPELT